MVLVASETGHVYTFSTQKFQPILNSKPGRKLIQTCLANETVDEADIADIDIGEIEPINQSGPINKNQQSPNSQSSQSSMEIADVPPQLDFRSLPMLGQRHISER